MARILILGAGISGHTVARYLGKWLGKSHAITVVSPKPKWNWIPSNIWVGVGEMTEKQATFEQVHYEILDGSFHEIDFDFAMLIPPFAGQPLKAYDKSGEDITAKIFAPNGFMKVDGDYEPKPYEDWGPQDWPKTYQTPLYKNMFAVGIAFAPPHLISKPMKSANGTPINPTPPRTGMPSAAIGKAVATSIRDMINGAAAPTHTASMAEIGAACVASTGSDIFKGTAATMTVFPVVPDFDKYPQYGRDMDLTFGEIGLAGHWMKYILHHVFIYQAKLRPGWSILPD